jgi:nucleoside phosphorylase
MSFSRDDYTVAWICALPHEMAAAKIMLDRTHLALHQPKPDHNVYTLGSIAGHNVVMACLPSGIYGTNSAAIVVATMLTTFPCLQFALLVGIGGGVPSETCDIRLGDVVVSVPTVHAGGVVQYDFGKTLREGRLQRTGSLNTPPQVLLNAVSQMRSNRLIGKDPPIRSPNIYAESQRGREFARPENDWLFSATYDHEGTTNCLACDSRQLVSREPRTTQEPQIHYGLIASGNQVMKDARTRDCLAQELGIICFEMEAAGLMNQLPSLVIRGICDYCDSHKQKDWQGYAALSAAVYAKSLISLVPITIPALSLPG